MKDRNALAEYFYEALAGSTSGHMAMVPNNPTTWGLLKAVSGTNDNCYAISKTGFAEFLRQTADNLEGKAQ